MVLSSIRNMKILLIHREELRQRAELQRCRSALFFWENRVIEGATVFYIVVAILVRVSVSYLRRKSLKILLDVAYIVMCLMKHRILLGICGVCFPGINSPIHQRTY